MTAELELRDFAAVHVAQTFQWIQDPELRRLFLMRGEPTWEGHVAHFERVLADPAQRAFAVYYQGRHVGNCGFKNIVPRCEGELWIYIAAPGLRGKGVGKAATRSLIGEGFRGLGFQRIYLHVADFNAAARALYRGLGFGEVPLPASEEWSARDCQIVRMELFADGAQGEP